MNLFKSLYEDNTNMLKLQHHYLNKYCTKYCIFRHSCGQQGVTMISKIYFHL